MFKVYRMWAPEAAHAASSYLFGIDIDTMTGNAATDIVSAQRRPVKICALANEFKGDRLEADSSISFWRKYVRTTEPHVYLSATSDDLGRAKSALEESVFKRLSALLTQINAQFLTVPDYGSFVDAALQSVGWNKEAVMLPALSYAKPHFTHGPIESATEEELMLAASNGGDEINFTHVNQLAASWLLPGLNRPGQASLVEGLIAMDQPRWQTGLIPDLSAGVKIEQINVTERPRGEMLRWRKLVAALAKPFLLTEIQPLVRGARARQPFIRWVTAAIKLMPQIDRIVAEEVQRYGAAIDLIANMPAHEVISYTTAGLGTLRGIGQFGIKPAVPMVAGSENGLTGLDELKVTVESVHGDGELFRLAETFLNYLRHNEAVNLHWIDLCALDGWVDARSAVFALQELGMITSSADTVAALGWREAACTLGTIDFAGADYAITDGERWTEPASQVALGLTPSVGLNNRKAYAEFTDLNKAWNITSNPERSAGPMEYSVCLVKGHLSALKSGVRYERNFVVESAHLGEDGDEPTPLNGDLEDMHAALRNYFAARSPLGYLRKWYPHVQAKYPVDAAGERQKDKDGRLLPVSARNPYWLETVWDAQGSSAWSAKDKMQTLYLSEFNSDIVPADNMIVIHRDAGFNIRYPVKFARGTRLFYAYPDGTLFAYMDQRGAVLTAANMGTVSLMHDNSEIDTFSDLMSEKWNLSSVGGREGDDSLELPVVAIGSAPMGIIRQ